MDSFPSDTDILSLSGADALQWFQAVTKGSKKARMDLDWSGLAKGAALRARIHEADESLQWAELATAIYQRLDKDQPGREHDHSEMYCIASMIEKHGMELGHPLRDPHIIFDWFRQQPSVDIEVTKTLIGRLTEEMSTEFETNVVAPLRAIRNRLTVIIALPDECERPTDIEPFVQLYHQLP